MNDCCANTIDTSVLERQQRRLLGLVLGINLLTFAMMVGAAYLSGSSSLLSGALDNLGDALTYSLSFLVVGASVLAKARVALFKGIMITFVAIAVAIQIGWRLLHLDVPVVTTMGAAATLNLAANLICLKLLNPYRNGDVNMASAWECSRNDVAEGVAVITTALLVWLFDSGWPDVLVALVLLVLFGRSAYRVLDRAIQEMRQTVRSTTNPTGGAMPAPGRDQRTT